MLIKHYRIGVSIWFAPLLLAVLVFSAVIHPLSANAAPNQAVAQGYSGSSAIQPGMVVSLDKSNPGKVDPLTPANINRMLGVVVSANQTALTLGQSNASEQVFVANYGLHSVLVSSENGPVKVGDYLTISSVAGIAMVANQTEPLVLGQAAGDFSGTSGVLSSEKIKTSSGQETISIGLVPIYITIAGNPMLKNPSGLPTFLNKITSFATDKRVSAFRAYLSMLIVLAGLILTFAVIYSGVKNGILSLGRNPLAKKVIGGGMIRIILAGIIILALSLVAAYFVLT